MNCLHILEINSLSVIQFAIIFSHSEGCLFTLLIVLIVSFQRRQWHPTPVLLPGESHGCMSLVGCSPWGCQESDTTEWLHFHFSLSCIGEGNGNPLQCSCLEDPRDGGAWWATIYGVAQSQTQLKWRSSSSSSSSSNSSKLLITHLTPVQGHNFCKSSAAGTLYGSCLEHSFKWAGL